MTIPEQVQQPTYPQYTNLALNEGLFDQLMKSVEHHLDSQYEKNRIRGTDYAQVYVGSMQQVLQNTTQYLLGILFTEEQKDKFAAETALIEKQTEQVDLQMELVELEKLKLKYEIEELLPLEKQKFELEVERVRQEGLLLAAQIDKITAEIAHMLAQQSLWAKQEDKIDAEILYLDAQKDMMLKQADKIDKEIEFLTWKIETEKANTQTGIAANDSLVGKQIDLLNAQRIGFSGDLMIKAAKVQSDYDAVVQGVLEIPANVALSVTGSKGHEWSSAAYTLAGTI